MRHSIQRQPLDGEHFDVAVVGGGVNGVAIARVCAFAGQRTLLLERHDFASGTTSRSTRIIHGGLRYLEHGELGLVRESVQARDRLLRERGHLVRPLEFLLALPPGQRSALEVRLGLWLYRRFGGSRRRENGDGRAELERLLDRNGDRRVWSVFTYDDAQCEFPERLVTEWLVEALAAGLVARNYTRALSIERDSGRAIGLRARDLLNGHEFRIAADTIINATGPWADELCRESDVETGAPMVGGVRGSHLVLPRFAGAPDVAVYTEAVDGRPIFLIPWNGQLLFGTTEVPDAGDPGRAQPTLNEIEYLLGSFARLFPRIRLNAGDVRATFAGVRPLPYSPGQPAASVTRRSLLHDHAEEGASGLISVIGGKLTTAATLARQCARKIGIAVPEPEASAVMEWREIERLLLGYQEAMPPPLPQSLAEWYGPRAVDIASRAENDKDQACTICEHTPHVVAEAVHAVECECAVTLGDILLRRVPVALGVCWSRECTRVASARIGNALQWTEDRIAAEAEEFEREYSAFMARVAPLQIRAA